MKKFFLALLIVLYGLSISGQQPTKEDLLKKSKSQKTWAWLFTAGGAALVVSGVIITSDNSSYFPSETVGPIMMAGGGLAIAGGVILFSASKKNETRANEMMALNLKLERSQSYELTRIVYHYYPALSLRIRIK
ncbi:MAG TPA: hypothetical protein VFO70_09405 [Chitinophagaceae bacterium]|nr:hypothetical protein [Chitinophagaceae bacterium]